MGNSKGNQTIQVEVKAASHYGAGHWGCGVSLLPESVMKSQFPHLQLMPSSVQLKTYTGEVLTVLGELPVQVQYGQQSPQNLRLVVVKGPGPCLFGRNWLQHIQLDWKQIATVTQCPNPPSDLDTLLEQYSDVFAEGLGTFEAKIHVKEGAKPKFMRARPVPFAMRAAVEEELDRLERAGVLNKVDHSEWATPVVVVPKKNGRVRLCGDYKVTLNPVIDVDQYPLPRSEDLFATLSVLDLSDAYQQIPL